MFVGGLAMGYHVYVRIYFQCLFIFTQTQSLLYCPDLSNVALFGVSICFETKQTQGLRYLTANNTGHLLFDESFPA